MKYLGARTACFPVRCALFLLFTFGVAILSAAQTPGVTDNSILVGSCSALDGPARFLGNQTVLGATTYLHSINDEGGVFGRKVQLLAFDDGYDPEKAPACFKRMTKEGVFALGFFVGTPTAKAYLPMAQDEKIPVVGLFTGAQMLYEPLKHYIINVRASYYDETREQVDKLWEINIHKIAVIYQDDAFGKTVLDGVKLALQKHGAAPAALGSFARNTLDVDDGLKSVMAAHPQAVVIVGPYAPVAAIVKKAHATGWRPQFLTVSFVGTEEFIKEAGVDAEGTVITPGGSSIRSRRLPNRGTLPAKSHEILSRHRAEFCESGGFRGRHGAGGRTEASGERRDAGKVHRRHRVDTWDERGDGIEAASGLRPCGPQGIRLRLSDGCEKWETDAAHGLVFTRQVISV